jgi:Txe/YoeB family toxin of Txe-Axe toxin-antitoxin module
MVFKGKEVQVALVGDAKQTYLSLKDIVSEEIKSGKLGTDYQKIFNSINRTIEQLKKDPQFGIHIRKEQIPFFYIKKFGAENLWKCDISNFWRLIYWIDGSDEVKIVSFVLDIIDHKIYNKRFNYRKN